MATVARVHRTAPSFFDFKLIESPASPDANCSHAKERIHYMVVEEGDWSIYHAGESVPGVNLIAGRTPGTTATVGESHPNKRFFRVAFPRQVNTQSAVLVGLQTMTQPGYATVRQKPLGSYGLDVAIEGYALETTTKGPEEIGWLVMEPGSRNWSGRRFHVGQVSVRGGDIKADTDYTTVAFPDGYFSEAPRIYASMSSYRGADHAILRYKGLDRNGVKILVQEEESCDLPDADCYHVPEVVSYLAIAGSGGLWGKRKPKRCGVAYGTVLSSCAVTDTCFSLEQRQTYASEARRLFSTTVFNDGHMWRVRRSDGSWTLDKAEQVANWAVGRHGRSMKYHSVIWHKQNLLNPGMPDRGCEEQDCLDWYEHLSSADALSALEEHIKTVVRTFRRAGLQTFELVNHALKHPTDSLVLGQGFMLTGVTDRAALISQVFRWATEVYPGAQFLVNEQIVSLAESERYASLISEIIAAGGRVDAIGVMGHFSNCGYPVELDTVDAILGRLGDIRGLDGQRIPIHITEFDVGFLPRGEGRSCFGGAEKDRFWSRVFSPGLGYCDRGSAVLAPQKWPPHDQSSCEAAPFSGTFYPSWYVYRDSIYPQLLERFSKHPVVEKVNFWGFWENAHWKPSAAMLRSDFSTAPFYDEIVPELQHWGCRD